MSRPPRPHFRNSTTDGALHKADLLEYAPLKFADLLELQKNVAESEAQLATTDSEGDLGRTLMALSALVGHALAMHQDLYASEAYLGTAKSDVSLVRHARRLAYEPDPGVAATGFAALTIGAGLKGSIPQGFSLASVPLGEVKAQDYETLAALTVDAAWNAMLPQLSQRAVTLMFDAAGVASFRVAGLGLALTQGEPVLLVSAGRWLALTVRSADENNQSGETNLTVEGGPPSASMGAAGFQVFAKPSVLLHKFGWNATGAQFTAEALKSGGEYAAPTTANAVNTVRTGYTAEMASGAGYSASDVYLDQPLNDSLVGTMVLAWASAVPEVFQVTAQDSARVSFSYGTVISVPTVTVTNNNATTGTTPQVLQNSTSGAVASIRLARFPSTSVLRSLLPTPSPLLAKWSVQSPVIALEPDPTAAAEPMEVNAGLTGMRPGRALVFSTLDDTQSQVVQLRKLQINSSGTSTIWWTAVSPQSVANPWTRGDLKILGNIGSISHGESVNQILGGSDGITPFLRFELKKAPLTMLPDASGAAPSLDILVNDVTWARVEDFYDSGPMDRDYRLELDSGGKASILFGDGIHGAIPASGKKHIAARYRTGLGAQGNTAPGQVSRIKKANPLVSSAVNRTAIGGGADPSRLEDIRAQAVRYVRTFDRAVSVQDYADLALLFPGVVRSSARWDAVSGIRLVAAVAEGTALPAMSELSRFLDARRDTQMPLALLDPEPIDLYITLVLESHPDYLTENVKIAVQDRLYNPDPENPGMFVFATRDFGQAAFLSELYEAVENVEGVTFADVTRFALSAPQAVFDVLEAGGTQWLRLQPQNCDISIATGGTA